MTTAPPHTSTPTRAERIAKIETLLSKMLSILDESPDGVVPIRPLTRLAAKLDTEVDAFVAASTNGRKT